MRNKRNFNSKGKFHTRKTETEEQIMEEVMHEIYLSQLESLRISENSPEALLIKAVYNDAINQTKQLFLNPVLDNQLNAIPPEIFWSILLYTSYHDWYHACLVSKSWHQKLSEHFIELKNLYETYKETSDAILIREAKANKEVATMLFMSDLVDKINFDDMIAIASHTPNHLETVFRRSQFFSNYYLPEKQSCLNTVENYNQFFTKRGEFGKKILYTLVQSSPQNAEQVIKKMVSHLNGYTLMTMAKISVQHAQIILADKLARERLKKGHLIGIAKKSLEHMRLFLDSPQLMLVLGSQGLHELMGQDNPAFSLIVFNKLLHYTSYIPFIMTKNSIANIRPVISLLMTQRIELFYSNKNPIWPIFQEKNPELGKLLPLVFVVTQRYITTEFLIKNILLRIALLSSEHLNEILLNSKTHKLFDDKAIARLVTEGPAYKDAIAILAPALLENSLDQQVSFNNV